MRFSLISKVLALTTLLASTSVLADWELDPAASSLHFISTKNAAVAEVHSFKSLSGGINAAGSARVKIALASVDTAIAIRDERMQEFLFQTAQFPSATISAQVELAPLAALAPGQQEHFKFPITLDLHGASAKLMADVTVTALANQRIEVRSSAPLLVNAADFDLVQGLAKLQELAGLKSISTSVPVTFSLVWQR